MTRLINTAPSTLPAAQRTTRAPWTRLSARAVGSPFSEPAVARGVHEVQRRAPYTLLDVGGISGGRGE
jgi:hypothetical protein